MRKQFVVFGLGMLFVACGGTPKPQPDFVSAVRLTALSDSVFVERPILIGAEVEGQLNGKPDDTIDESRQRRSVTWTLVSGQGKFDSGLSLARFIPDANAANSNVVIRAASNFDPTKTATITLAIKPEPAAGTPETSFGTGGRRVARFTKGATELISTASAVEQSGSKFLLAGYSYPGKTVDLTVGRSLEDGTPDSSFGSLGSSIVSFDPANSQANGVAERLDGKIVIAGSASTDDNQDIAVVRLLPTGSLDAGFGVGGKLKLDFGGQESGQAVAVQANGKVLVGVGGSQATLVRLNEDGGFDTSFNTTGRVTLNTETGSYIEKIVVQPDGKILVGGGNYWRKKRLILRLNSDGSTDSSFDASSLVNNKDFSDLNALALAADGRVLIASTVYLIDGSAGYVDGAVQVSRLSSTGRLDTSFGTSGKVSLSLDFSKSGNVNHLYTTTARGLHVLSDGDVLVTAEVYDSTTVVNADFGAFRFASTGTLKKTWVTGFDADQQGNRNDIPRAAFVRSDNRIMVVGEINAGYGSSFFGRAIGFALFNL